MHIPDEMPKNLYATHEAHTPTRAPKKRSIAAVIALMASVIIFIAFFTVPVPYVVTTPGPTIDLKDSSEGLPVITVSGTRPDTGQAVQPEEDTEGELRMVTISEYGGPGNPITAFDVFRLGMSSHNTIENYYDVYDDEITADDVQSFAQAQMTSSHSTAAVAALEEIGWNVPATVIVTEVAPQADAYDKILPDDVLISVTTPDGKVTPIDKASAIFTVMATQAPGTSLVITVERDGKQQDITVKSHEAPDGIGSKLGIYLHIDTTLPVNVEFHLENIGGPSAGMMFALATIDYLTPGDMTGGQRIAGTGAIGYDGRVQPIGGLQQKIVGAQGAGARYFLAPSLNCDEIETTPHGIDVFRVDTLKEAREAVGHISQGRTENLRSCVAPK